MWICAFGVKLIALEIHNQLTAESITLVIVANDSVLTLSSGVYHTKAFALFSLYIAATSPMNNSLNDSTVQLIFRGTNKR